MSKNGSNGPRPEQAQAQLGFQNLMRNRIHQVLLVSSLYDSFILSQDGQINELLLSDFMALNLYQAPEMTRVPRANEALKLLEEQRDRFNLIITTAHVGSMHVLTFAKRVREMGIKVPIVLLSYENKEVQGLKKRKDIRFIDKIFLWQGDFRMLLAIVKYVEDQINVEHDTSEMGVQTIILIEDNTHFYSSYLPMLYTELMKHSQSLIGEGLNTGHKILRMRARPKILLCETYDEAWEYFEAYAPYVMGVISDVEFERNGEKDSNAGATFVAEVKRRQPDMPVLLQSFRQDMDSEAEEIGARFIRKDSPTLLKELKAFLTEQLGFGDFRFLTPDGEEVDRAKDLRMLEEKLRTIPDDSLIFHAERNHFSNWLKTRTEFALADKLKPRKVSDYPSTDALRDYLIESLRNSRRELQRELLVDFSKESFDPDTGFARIGGGSLGGKGRGLAFMHHLLNINRLGEQFKDVTITVPPTVVLCSDVFDSFLDTNDLRDYAVQSMDEEDLIERFLKAEMPEDVYVQLGELVEMVDYPLAVRSSSLLEDSQYQPFAGVYETYMLTNNHPQVSLRLEKLISTIKRIFASMYRELARRHISATPYRLEEEKMAVVIQRLIGRRHGPRYYPEISGVAKSYNYYPKEPMDAKDGVVSLALGLGKLVVEGGETVRVCPKYPKHVLAPSTTEEFLEHSQKKFYSLNLEAEAVDEHGAPALNEDPLSVAEEDMTLHYVGSVYSHENDAMYDGLSRAGVRLVTFSPVLKLGVFPLPSILTDLLRIATEGTGGPVEVEFAANLSVPKGEPKEFSVLQIRPMVLNRDAESIDFNGISEDDILCESEMVLGVGQMDDIYDILYVDITEFNRAETRKVAQELEWFNGTLGAEKRPYLLIGVGRWGSSDPWLGIPVSWDQISGAKVIVETGFKDIKVTPSQGAHFFHNLMSFMIGYFTINPAYGEGRIDWEWLRNQQVEREGVYVRHLRFSSPVVVKMNGSKRKGVICKPSVGKR